MLKAWLLESFSLNFTETLWLRFLFGDHSYLLCACYHPLRPKYSTSEFIDQLDSYIERNLLVQDDCFILVGDLNKLNVKHENHVINWADRQGIG